METRNRKRYVQHAQEKGLNMDRQKINTKRQKTHWTQVGVQEKMMMEDTEQDWQFQDIIKRWGIDYEASFAPVITEITLRILLEMNMKHKWDIKKIDIETEFLEGELDEEIYIKAPPGM